MYIGVLVGILYHLKTGRKGGLPSRKMLAALGLLLVVFGVDGTNSYFHLFPNFIGLYEPNNIFRLVTGTGMGVGMAAILMPIMHQTFWQTWDPEPTLNQWRNLFGLLAAALAVSSLLLTENPLFLYPLALLHCYCDSFWV